MPNWCFNQLTVTGPDEHINRFINQSRSRRINWENKYKEKELEMLKFSFNGIYPPPESVIKEGFHKKGHNWCYDNWGTKWEPRVTHIERNEEYLEIFFETAWNSPNGWLDKAAMDFTALHFKLAYYEDGFCFTGMIEYENGEIINDRFYRDNLELVQKKATELLGIEFN